MSKDVKLENESLAGLIGDPVVVRVVSVLDIATLSNLELLEYSLTRRYQLGPFQRRDRI